MQQCADDTATYRSTRIVDLLRLTRSTGLAGVLPGHDPTGSNDKKL